MAFDPILPIDDSLIVALELRNQFNALKALIDALQTTLNQQAAQITALQQDVAQQSAGLLNVQGAVATVEANAARNPTSVGPLSVQLSNPMTNTDGSEIVNKINEMLNALSHP